MTRVMSCETAVPVGSRPRRQGPPAGDVGVGRLRGDRRHTADRRRAPGRSGGRARASPRAGRGGWKRQRDARRGAALRHGDLHRLRPRAPRARAAPRGSRRVRQRRVRSRGCRVAAVSGRQLRHRALDIRSDVRARSPAGGGRAHPGVQARRPDRAGELDAVRLPRRAPPSRGEVRAAGPRRSVSRSSGARTLTSASCSQAPAGSRRRRDRSHSATGRRTIGYRRSGTSTDRRTPPSWCSRPTAERPSRRNSSRSCVRGTSADPMDSSCMRSTWRQ